MEIMYGARRTGMSRRDYLAMLRDAGLDTIPGTAAEILDDDVREAVSHKKVDVRTWVQIVTAAQELGIRSSATLMYGHVESCADIATRIAVLGIEPLVADTVMRTPAHSRRLARAVLDALDTRVCRSGQVRYRRRP